MLPRRFQVPFPLPPPLLVALTCYQGGQRKKQPRSRGSLFPSLSLSTGKGRREAWKRGSILTWRLRGVLSSQPVWWLRTGFLGNSSEFNTLKRRIKRLVLPPPQKYHVLYRTEYQVALRKALVLPYIKQKNDKVIPFRTTW